MTTDSQTIEQLIRAALPDCTVRLSDLRGDGAHYAAYIVSPAFRGKTRVEQHRMVYEALQNQTEGALQSLAIQTATPEDAEK